jgi:hypothetical protein
MMSISHSDLMPIRSERSDAELSQCEIVIGIRQGFCSFSFVVGASEILPLRVCYGFGR